MPARTGGTNSFVHSSRTPCFCKTWSLGSPLSPGMFLMWDLGLHLSSRVSSFLKLSSECRMSSVGGRRGFCLSMSGFQPEGKSRLQPISI